MAKEVTCSPPCSFRVRSETESELVAMVQQHAKNQHQLNVSTDEVLKMAKCV